MTQPTFAFTTPAQQPNDQAGLQQYLQQGQASINPGQSAVTGSSPIAAAGVSDLAKALATMQQQPATPQLQPGVSQAALGAGAAMTPNSATGENMGGVGPTQQNMALAQGLQNAAQMPGGASPQPFVPPNPYGISYGG
jgi:hypothetical protein